MPKARLFCAALLTALALLWSAAPSGLAANTARVAYVYDGDTVRLDDGRKIRLAGIDTPEKDPEQYWARRAAARLRDLLDETGRQVRLEAVTTDHYGRVVAEVRTLSGVSLNERMLSEGMATFYAHKELSEGMSARLLAAQRAAIAKRAGCWQGLLARREARQPFTGNRNSRRFFSQDCRGWERIAVYNRVAFRSLEEAFLAGFAPVRVCNIWPLQHAMERGW